MSYSLKLHTSEDISATERSAAQQRFRGALEAELGDASLVLPMYTVCLVLQAQYGDSPDPSTLPDAERRVFESWQLAHAAALRAALGPHRYLDDAWFEISE
jgi:hypothetical protein